MNKKISFEINYLIEDKMYDYLEEQMEKLNPNKFLCILHDAWDELTLKQDLERDLKDMIKRHIENKIS